MNPAEHHPHLGELLALRLKELGMSKAEFGRRIHTSRQNVSLILQKPSLDTAMLWKISQVVGHDYFLTLAETLSGAKGADGIIRLEMQFSNQRLILVTSDPLPGGTDQPLNFRGG